MLVCNIVCNDALNQGLLIWKDAKVKMDLICFYLTTTVHVSIKPRTFAWLIYFAVISDQVELNEVRMSLLETLDNPAEIITLVNKLNFGQCTYLLSVYRVESLRVSSDPGKFYSIFDYLEDRAIEKDKAGKKLGIILLQQ